MMPQLLLYLQLCRLPTVFTAMADIFLGYLLVHTGIVTGNGSLREFLLLLGASACLYLSGMVWNDIFDREVDAIERPNRPIPSGRVTIQAARIFAGSLMLAGLGLAGAAALTSVMTAGLLAVMILAYDGGLKRTLLGPVAMGNCRFFNVLLGASSGVTAFSEVLTLPQIWVASGLGMYIVGVTWFARTEAKVSNRWHLIGAMVVVNLGLATLIGWITNTDGENQSMVLMAMAIILLTINRRLAAAVAQPLPERVQPAIRTMLLSIIVLDATLIAHHLGPDGVGYAIATVALLIPAMTVGRWIRMT